MLTGLRQKIKIMKWFTPWTATWTATLLLVVMALGLTPDIRNIQYRSEITDYFRADNPKVMNFHKLEAELGLQQSLLILHRFQQAALNEQNVLSLFHISRQIHDLDGVTRVQSVLSTAVSDEQQNTLSLYRYLLQQEKRSEPITLTDSLLGQLADNARSQGTLLSEDGHTVSLSIHFHNTEVIAELYPAIEHILQQQTGTAPGSDYFMLGPVEIKQALHHALLHDGFYLMPLVLLIGTLVLWYFLRSLWLVLSGAVSIVVALWLTAGWVGALQWTINQTSALAFCIAFIIALADIIHLLTSYSHQLISNPTNKTHAMKAALKENGSALFLTSLTTGIGFLSLNGSSSPVFATFGNIAAIGVGLAFLCAICITPVLAVLAPIPNRNAAARADVFQRCIPALNRFRHRLKPIHYGLFYGASALLCAGLIFNHYHNDPLDYFERDSGIIRATELSEQQFGVHHPVSVSIDSGNKDGIYSETFLVTLAQFHSWLLGQEDVSQSSSYLTTLTQLKRHVHSNDLKWAAPPRSAQETADLWNLYEMASPDNEPHTLGLDQNFRTAVVNLGVVRLQSPELLQLEQRILHWFEQHAPDYSVNVSGHALLFADIGKELTRNMFIGGLLSALVISVLIGMVLRNVKLGMLSLLPNLIPAGIVYGVWGASVGVIDIAAAGTLCISLGIVVDDSIHILKRYRDFRLSGLSPQSSLDHTLQQVGSALMLTTLILVAGLLVLTLSVFGPNQTTALLMAAIISVALAYDLIMLPHLLIRFDPWLFPGSPVHTTGEFNPAGPLPN